MYQFTCITYKKQSRVIFTYSKILICVILSIFLYLQNPYFGRSTCVYYHVINFIYY